jgi:hypothetical protein
VIYNALAAAGKYVSLDLSGSNVTGFEYDVETGRTLVVHLVLPDSLEEMEDCVAAAPAFGGFPNLKSVSASGLWWIGSYVFYNCTSIETVTLDATTDIGGYAFNGCTSLAAVNLPKAVSLGINTFFNCTSLTAITLPEAASIGGNSFSGCASLATANLPKAESLGDYAFRNCTDLITVSLPKATSIGRSAFSHCTSLATISLPEVETMGVYMFDTCTSMTSVILGETPPAIAVTFIFMGAATEAKTITIKVPGGKLADYQNTEIETGKTWADVTNTTNTSTGYFWDNILATRGNLTVALEAISG